MEIKYIGLYDFLDMSNGRTSSLALIKKMDYISEAINKAGYDVLIVSPSWSNSNEKICYKKSETFQVHSDKKVTFCPTYSSSKKISIYIRIVLALLWLFYWLVKNTKRDEKIIVYHAQWLSLPLRLAKRIKKLHLILEVEELYYDVWENKNILNQWERKLIDSADSYIAVSDVLAKLLGPKVRAVIYGDYTVHYSTNHDKHVEKNKINVVYAGTIDDLRGAAFNAVRCAELLPENFIVHIVGTGEECLVLKLKKMIDLINKKKSRNACLFHGVIIGKEYDDFLCNCQIGINSQKEGDYMNTAFPSKVISYLSHNLAVISTKIKSIEESKLRSLILFTKDDKPESFAEAIMSFDLQFKINYQEIIEELDKNFVESMKQVLSDYTNVRLRTG